MSIQPDSLREAADNSHAPAPRASETRPLYWSVRRELWENRAIYIAPVAVAGVVLFGFAMSTIGMPHRRRAVLALDPLHQRALIERPYNIVAGMLIITAFIIAAFYCLDALHGERRDRSILFWKSLPVSDWTAVLAKAVIPLAIMPALMFVVILVVHLAMLVISSAVLAGSGMGESISWPMMMSIVSPLPLLYALIAASLWHAPIYAWLLMISAWARRSPFLWAVLPPFALALFERITFGTSHIGQLVQYRLAGWITEAFAMPAKGQVVIDPPYTPGHFLSTGGLWFGLLIAAVFLAAAVRLRRDRGPI